MGFLIFACRKLSLKSKITDLQYRQMCLQNQKSTIEDQISQRQQMYSNSRDSREAYMSQSIYTMKLNAYQMAQGDPKAINAFQATGGMTPEMMNMMSKNQIAGMLENDRNNIDLQALARKDKEIERQMATLESQLKIATNELESVEKAEDNAAKQSTPKFGLS